MISRGEKVMKKGLIIVGIVILALVSFFYYKGRVQSETMMDDSDKTTQEEVMEPSPSPESIMEDNETMMDDKDSMMEDGEQDKMMDNTTDANINGDSMMEGESK